MEILDLYDKNGNLTGKTYNRILTTPENAIKLLGWGESAEKPIRRAFEIAQEIFNLKATKFEDEWL